MCVLNLVFHTEFTFTIQVFLCTYVLCFFLRLPFPLAVLHCLSCLVFDQYISLTLSPGNHSRAAIRPGGQSVLSSFDPPLFIEAVFLLIHIRIGNMLEIVHGCLRMVLIGGVSD